MRSMTQKIIMGGSLSIFFAVSSLSVATAQDMSDNEFIPPPVNPLPSVFNVSSDTQADTSLVPPPINPLPARDVVVQNKPIPLPTTKSRPHVKKSPAKKTQRHKKTSPSKPKPRVNANKKNNVAAPPPSQVRRVSQPSQTIHNNTSSRSNTYSPPTSVSPAAQPTKKLSNGGTATFL